MISINPEYKPPPDYKPPMIKVNDKVMIPQEEHPEINFVGLLIGPRGNTLKSMESETGAKIIIRGKGSVKEGKVGRKDGQPLPGEDEPLHAYVTATNPEAVKKAVEKIKQIIREAVDVPEGQNDLRRHQLRELALLNGTLREGDGPRCTNCGAADHKAWQCEDKPNVTNNVVCTTCGGAGHIAKDCMGKKTGEWNSGGSKNAMDEEYMSLMAELGEGPAPPGTSSSSSSSSSNREEKKPWQRNNSGGGGQRMFRAPGPPRPLMGPRYGGPGPMGPPPPPGENDNGGWGPTPPPAPPGTKPPHSSGGNWNMPPPPPGMGAPPPVSGGYGMPPPGYGVPPPPPPGPPGTSGSNQWSSWGGPPPGGHGPVPPPPGTKPPPSSSSSWNMPPGAPPGMPPSWPPPPDWQPPPSSSSSSQSGLLSNLIGAPPPPPPPS